MILRGVIENIFGGALCFRGFARIEDLAKLSYAKDSYQRPVDTKRSKEILNFLRNGEFRFFPEITLNLFFRDDQAIPAILNGSPRGKIALSDEIDIHTITKDYKDYLESDKFDSPLLRRIALDFKDETKKYLSRIDGNHRLSAVDLLIEDINDPDKKVNSDELEALNYLVPFNILMQFKGTDAERNEIAFFHLINSKAQPLSSEENLRSIFENNFFSQEQIKQLVGEHALRAKELYEAIKDYNFLGIQPILENNLKSFCIKCTEKFNNDITVSDIQNSIQQIDSFYKEKDLGENTNENLLLAFTYIKTVKDKETFDKFKKWIVNNHIFEIKEISSDSIIQIFEKVHLKRIFKIFVAMPYWSHSEVTEYNNLFKEVCREASKKISTTIELIPIMRFQGKSKRIDARLIEKIKECDVFVADITGCNKNVIFEVGLAEGLDKHMILIKAEQDKKMPPFDMDKLQYIPYNQDAYYGAIKGIVTRNLTALLIKEYDLIHNV